MSVRDPNCYKFERLIVCYHLFGVFSKVSKTPDDREAQGLPSRTHRSKGVGGKTVVHAAPRD
jgi:hypothetical protein